jgi:hypothetical protein
VELADRNWRFPRPHSLCSYFCGAAVPRRAPRTVGSYCRREYSYPGQYSGGSGGPSVLITVFIAHLMKVVALVVHLRTWLSFLVWQITSLSPLGFFCAGETINWVYIGAGRISKFSDMSSILKNDIQPTIIGSDIGDVGYHPSWYPVLWYADGYKDINMLISDLDIRSRAEYQS